MTEFRKRPLARRRTHDRPLDLVERHSLADVCVDEPQGFNSSVPPAVARNRTGSRGPLPRAERGELGKKVITAAERFHYDYSAEELEEWVPYQAGSSEVI